MDQRQKNTRKMYTNVLQFFLHAGSPLLGIKKIAALVAQATADVATLDAEALRVLPKTPAGHACRAKGATPFNVPQLAYHLHEEDVPTPTLANTGGRGHEVVFYLGAMPTSHPRPGQGLLVKNGKKVTLSDYSMLGDAAIEPYLLVMQTSELAAGGWRVRG